VIVGLPLMLAELMIGRKAEVNPVGAFQKLHKPYSAWAGTGWLAVVATFLIMSFYCVVAGWALAFIFKSIVGFSGTPDQIQGEFLNLAGSAGQSILWHTLFLAASIAIVIGGIQRGIERWSKILMPLLFAILLGLMLYGLFGTDSGIEALNFLFNPNFSELSAEGMLSALGHAFFTLSIGMGIMITYGSYMRKEESLLRDAVTISFLDTLIALMAGIAIFSMVFQYNMEPGQGVGLIFQTLPVLFAETGPWVSVPFFILLTFAALTSAISGIEVVVSYFIDRRGWSRIVATIFVGAAMWLFGMLSASWSSVFDFFDDLTTNYMLPIGGFLTCLFTAWVMKNRDRVEEFGSSGVLYRGLIFTLKFITPIAVLIVILHGLQLLPFMDYPE
jgi:NSS family neurotransmitter:Na+ symporter